MHKLVLAAPANRLHGEILTRLMRLGSQSRVELAEATGVDASTIARALPELLAEGWIGEAVEHQPERGRGRPSKRVTVREAHHLAVGVKIGPDALSGAVTDLAGVVVARTAGTWPSPSFTQLYPAGSQTQYTDIDKKLTITVPKMSVTVFKAAKAVAKSSAAPSVSLTGMTPGATITDRWQVKARTSNQGGSNDQVTFVAKVGNGAWKSIGTDDNPGWSVWFDPSGVPTGTQVTFRAIVTDNNGHSRVSNGVVQVIGANASERAQKAPVDTPKSLQPQQRGR